MLANSDSLNYMTAKESQPVPFRSKSIQRQLGPLAGRNFRVFYLGYTTSLLGSAMSGVALTFAVLGAGDSATDLGLVFAAGVVPQVLVMIGGGVLADRAGRRRVMLVTDTLRFGVQSTLAVALFAGRPPVWVFMALAGLLSTGEGFFTPAFGGLRTEITRRDQLADAGCAGCAGRAGRPRPPGPTRRRPLAGRPVRG